MSGPGAETPFWVPLLTHYEATGGIDHPRMAAHLSALRPQLGHVLLAGSTGDGWNLPDRSIEQLAAFAADDAHRGVRFMIGALRATTDEVLATCALVEAACAASPVLDHRLEAIVICPPVTPDATQDAILAHYRAVLSATRRPLAVYQLPQVTGCRIAPDTFRKIAADSRVAYFKDSSGADDVARAVSGTWRGTLLRGAEGGYADALRPRGPYDGFLLSTGNVFAARYRDLFALIASGDHEAAVALSGELADAADVALAAGGRWPDLGNAFSLGNRAMDHVAAYGRDWREEPLPRLWDGKTLPVEIVGAVETVVLSMGGLGSSGYLGLDPGSGR